MSGDELTPAPWAREPAPTDDDLVKDGAGELQDHWKIRDLDSAEWAMDKLRQAQAQAVTIARQYDAWRARLDEWAADAGRRATGEMEFFRGHLERFALAEREATGEATLKLPSGKVSTVKRQRAVVVTDEEALMTWARTVAWEDEDGALVPLDVTIAPPRQKVLVSELRELVAVGDEPDPDQERLVWGCGCWAIVRRDAPLDEVFVGATACPTCGEVGGYTVEPVMAPVVRIRGLRLFTGGAAVLPELLDGGNPPKVPGVAVEPEHVTASVKPNPPPALANPEHAQLG